MDMKKKTVVRFKLLGSFSYALLEEEDYISNITAAVGRGREEYRPMPVKIGKKALSVLQYLIVNHSRNVTVEELIEVFWTEKNSSNPANALRYMVFKIRSLLKAMFPEQDDLLQTFQGYYAWNPEIKMEVDAESFEKCCPKGRKGSGEKDIEMLRQAVFTYNGDFLSGNDSEWTKTLRQYYKALYLDACKVLLPLLEEREEWMEIISVCSRAYQIDFCTEEFTLYPMQTFISMGQPEQAIERYEVFRRQLWRELEIRPTERVEQIYKLACGIQKGSKRDDKEIFEIVCEGNSDKKAFFCSFGMFQSIVALERRHLTRSGQKSTLVIVGIEKKATPTTDARRLERILLEGLRTGDPVARLEPGSYILMLTGTDTENAQIVISRLDREFHKTYRHSSAQLTFKLSQLRPEESPPTNL